MVYIHERWQKRTIINTHIHKQIIVNISINIELYVYISAYA